MDPTLEKLFEKISWKYGGITVEMLEKILIPQYYKVIEIDDNIIKRGPSFTVTIKLLVEGDREGVVRGQTGKIISQNFINGLENWKELGKARIHEVTGNIAIAEFFSKTGRREDLNKALKIIKIGDYMEIDNYGLSANLTSALTELAFSEIAKSKGFEVLRMPEDVAKHLGSYYNYDFEIKKDGITKKVEVKSLWGTNTDMARLIHSKTKGYETSSCKFETQDIFAVNLYLRTGRIMDFAYAVSEYEGNHPNGLPCAKKGKEKLIEYVHQNPVIEIGNGIWFSDLDEIWKIVTK